MDANSDSNGDYLAAYSDVDSQRKKERDHPKLPNVIPLHKRSDSIKIQLEDMTGQEKGSSMSTINLRKISPTNPKLFKDLVLEEELPSFRQQPAEDTKYQNSPAATPKKSLETVPENQQPRVISRLAEQQVSKDDSVERMDKVNKNLKEELLQLIATMETQLQRVASKRTKRLKGERRLKEDQKEQLKQLKYGVSKIQSLKTQIECLWSDLEFTYNNELVTNLENELQGRKAFLLELYNETLDQKKDKATKAEVIEEKQGERDRWKTRMNQLSQQLRGQRTQFKNLKDNQRELMAEIKRQHTEILELEQKSKKLSSVIKEEKDNGTVVQLQQEIARQQILCQRITSEVEAMNEKKKEVDREFKQNLKATNEEILEMTSQIKLAEGKLKTLENDLKMTDFKIKELAKNIPRKKRVFGQSALSLAKSGHDTASDYGDSSTFLTQPKPQPKQIRSEKELLPKVAQRKESTNVKLNVQNLLDKKQLKQGSNAQQNISQPILATIQKVQTPKRPEVKELIIQPDLSRPSILEPVAKPKTPTKPQPIIKIETPIQKPVKVEVPTVKIEAQIIKKEIPLHIKKEEPPKPKFDLLLDDDEIIKEQPVEQPVNGKPSFKPFPGGGGGSKPQSVRSQIQPSVVSPRYMDVFKKDSDVVTAQFETLAPKVVQKPVSLAQKPKFVDLKSSKENEEIQKIIQSAQKVKVDTENMIRESQKKISLKQKIEDEQSIQDDYSADDFE